MSANNFSEQSVTTLRLSPVQPSVSARKSAHNSQFSSYVSDHIHC